MQTDTVATEVTQCKYLITGTVSNNIVEVIPHASVTFEGCRETYYTDGNGRFSIPVDELPTELKFNFMGYKTKVMAITEKNFQNLMVVFDDELAMMGEVVVVKPSKKWKRRQAREQHAREKEERKASRQALKAEKKAERERQKTL